MNILTLKLRNIWFGKGYGVYKFVYLKVIQFSVIFR
jgi:hypothetical protein